MKKVARLTIDSSKFVSSLNFINDMNIWNIAILDGSSSYHGRKKGLENRECRFFFLL